MDRVGLLPNQMMDLTEILRDNPRIILFDGVCNLCAWTLQFIFRNDRKSLYRFAWVQSPEGKEILRWCNLPDDRFDTMVTIEQGRAYFKSTAFLRVVRHLRFPWRLLWAGMLVPAVIRDRLYDSLARRRYGLFGRREVCRVPEGPVSGRFLAIRLTEVSAEDLSGVFIILSSCLGVSYI